jgi:undecaprenyl-diphosphatase
MLRSFKQLLQWLGPSEATVLVLLMLIAGGIWAFGEIADEVVESETVNIDQRFMEALRTDASSEPVGPPWLMDVARDITALGSYTILSLLGVMVVFFFGLKRNQGLMVLTAVLLAGGVLLSMGLKLLFARERPAIEQFVEVSSYSFPSAHALLSAVGYLTFGTLLAHAEREKRFKVFFLGSAVVLSAAVGLSRVYLGVHYPTDVLAGWIAGSVWALFCLTVAGILRRTRRANTGDSPPVERAGGPSRDE